MKLVVWAVLASVVLFGHASVAEIYQWRDAQGKVHFSDRKPAQREAEEVSPRLRDLNIDESGHEHRKLESVFRKPTAEEQRLERQNQAAQQRQRQEQQQQCQKLQKRLKILKGPVYFVREDGSTYDVSKTEHEHQIQELESRIAAICQP